MVTKSLKKSVAAFVFAAMFCIVSALALTCASASTANAEPDYTISDPVSVTVGKTVKSGFWFGDYGEGEICDITSTNPAVATAFVDYKQMNIDDDCWPIMITGKAKGSCTIIVKFGYRYSDPEYDDDLTSVYHIPVSVAKPYEMRIGTTVDAGIKALCCSQPANGKFYCGGDDWFAYSSSNSKVAKVYFTYDENEYAHAHILAVGKGSCTITLSTGFTAYFWDEETGDYEENVYYYKYKIPVTVTANANIPANNCDRLYTGEYYGIAGLFTDYGGSTIQASKWQGKFVAGTGYKVYSSGKYVKFTKTGKVTLKFKNSNGTRYITVNAVHSGPTAKASLQKTLKAKYKSYRYVSFKENKSTGKQELKYTVLKNGKRVTKTAYYWFSQGKVYKKF